MKTIIKNISILSQNDNKNFIERGFIVIENQNIIQIASMEDYIEETHIEETSEVIDGKGKYLVVPGFINAHTHIAMTLFRGYADDLPFWTWLTKRIWPQENKLNGEDAYWGTLLGIIEMIKTGTTTFNDMYMFMDHTARAVDESGIRAYLSRGLQGTNDNSIIGLKENRELFVNWHNKAEGRIKVMVGPHAIYTCDPTFWQEVKELVEETGMMIHTHLSESREEVKNSLAQYGKTPVKHLEDLGVLNYPTVVAHGVYLTDEDMDILRRYEVSIVHNPISNLKLGNGFAPISDLLNKGINVALGTDGASSNNNLDLLEEMGYAALIHKGFLEDSTAISAVETFDMATIKGAKALKWDGIGILEKGMKADLLMINTNDASFYPRYNFLSNLIYSSNSSHIENVMVNGRWLMKNKELLTIDEEKVFYQVERIKKKFN